MDMQLKQYRQLFGKPSFIIIHTDQQRADSIGAYGNKEVYTPYQNAIADMGMRFDSCYAPCPVCIPQRLSLLTGQSPQKHGVMDNVGIPDLELETNFALEMKKGGYKTALIGRTMHTYPFSDPYGFETYLPGDPSTDDPENDLFMKFVRENAPLDSGDINANGTYNNSRFASAYHLEDRFHQTMWATNRAIEYIRERKTDRKPYMLMLGYFAPHTPFNPPKDWMDYYLSKDLKDDRYLADYDVKPETNGHPISCYVDLKDDEYRRAKAGYYGNISFIDAQIGRIFNEIIAAPNTYIIFTSDHGEMLGDHYHMHKNAPYQGSVHTPFMICGPGIRGNSICKKIFTWQDVMPTVLEMAELPVPEACDGISFAREIYGEDDVKREYIHGEMNIAKVRFAGYEDQQEAFRNGEYNWAFENGCHYITDGKYKYIWFNQSGREQFFDIVNDYGEKNDLVCDPGYSELVTLFRGRLVRELEDRPEGFVENGELVSGKTEEQLSPEKEALCDQLVMEGKRIAYYEKAMMKLAMKNPSALAKLRF